MSSPGRHILATATIMLAVWSATLFDVTAQNTDPNPCRRSCDLMNSFYSRFRLNTNNIYVENIFLTNCYAGCPAVAINAQPETTTTTTTSTTTTTTTTRGYFRNAGCGVPTMSRYRIVGGTAAFECEFPWVVGIGIGNNFCGGTILDQFHILTAAHCLKDRRTGAIVNIAQVTVRVGSSQMSRLQVYRVAKMDVDERHVRVINDYDVAVLTLATSLVFSECVSPICLPEAWEDPKRAEFCVAAGWGVEYQNSDMLTATLQKVTLPIVDNALCAKSYIIPYVNELKFCAGNFTVGGIDTCQGDSGGPLMCMYGNRFAIYGIVSFGSGCARARYPGVYAYVAHPDILGYIKRIVGIN